MERIFNDYPEFRGDSMKAYMVERMVECYIADSDGFNKRATENERKEKKKGLSMTEKKPMADEIIAITKQEGEAQPVELQYSVGDDGYIKCS